MFVSSTSIDKAKVYVASIGTGCLAVVVVWCGFVLFFCGLFGLFVFGLFGLFVVGFVIFVVLFSMFCGDEVTLSHVTKHIYSWHSPWTRQERAELN